MPHIRILKVVVRPHVLASELFHYAWHDISIMLFRAPLWTAPLLVRPEGLIKVVVRPHVPASEVFQYAWHDVYIMLFSTALWTAPLLVRPEGLIKVVVRPVLNFHCACWLFWK